MSDRAHSASGPGPCPGADDSLLRALAERGVLTHELAPMGAAYRRGRYPVDAVLGCGGMGVVLAGIDPRSGAEVAIKLIHPHCWDHSALQLYLEREARIHARLRHANIIEILEVDECAGGVCLVMPRIRGGSLADRIATSGALDETLAIPVAKQICDALIYAHEEKGVIHRDLRPSNVLLSESGHVYLTDFGLARSVAGDTLAEQTGSFVMGTCAYMPPGVLAGRAEDFRWDIYGLGAVMYHMLTGLPPYGSELPFEELRAQILERHPPRIRTLNPAASPRLERIAEGAMRRSISERYPSARDLKEELERVERGRWPRGPFAATATDRRVARRAAAMAAAAAAVAAGWIIARSADRPDVWPREVPRALAVEADIPLGGATVAGVFVADLTWGAASHTLLVATEAEGERRAQWRVFEFAGGAYRETWRGELEGAGEVGFAAGDATHDANPDWIVGTGDPQHPGRLALYDLYDGQPRKQWEGEVFTGGARNLAIGNLGGDHAWEVAVGLKGPHRGVRLYRWGDGELKPFWQQEGNSVLSVHIGDADNDGLHELLVGSAGESWSDWRMYRDTGAGCELAWDSPPMGHVIAWCADVDRDAGNEVVVTVTGSSAGQDGLYIYKWNGNGFQMVHRSPDPRGSVLVGIGALLDTGTRDLAVLHRTPAGPDVIKIYGFWPTEGYWASLWLAEIPPGARGPWLGDCDGDEDTELILSEGQGPDARLRVLGVQR